ncbi:MAG: hypothetical protein R2862_03400 [Thermoanaerobaculia bacterium]
MRRLLTPLDRLALPRDCFVCGAEPTKRFELEVKRSLDLLFFRRTLTARYPVGLCARCAKQRVVTMVAAWSIFWLLFLGICFLMLTLAIDHDSPYATHAFVALLLLGLFGRLALRDLTVWLGVGVHCVLLPGKPPMARVAVRTEELFRRLVEADPQAER